MLLFAWRHGDILKLTYLNTVYRTTRQFSPESPTVGTSIFFSKSTASTVAPSFSKNILQHPLIHRVFRVQSLSNLYILPHWGNFHIYVYINGKCICESDNGIQTLILMPPGKILPQGEGNYTCPRQSFFKRSIFPQQKRGGRGSKVIGNYEIPY